MTVCSGGIHILDKGSLSILLYADDQIVVGKSVNKLQRSIYILDIICHKYNFKIYNTKIKTTNNGLPREEPCKNKNCSLIIVFWSRYHVLIIWDVTSHIARTKISRES